MHQFSISGRIRDKQSALVAYSESTYDTSSPDRGMYHRDVFSQLTLKGTVKVLRASDTNQAVGIGQTRKHSNVVAVLKLQA